MDITSLENKVNNIKRRSYNEIKSFLKEQLYIIQYKIPYEYKNKKQFEYLLVLSSFFPHIKKEITSDSPIYKLIIMINKCMHGQKILLKYYNDINKISNEILINIIYSSSESWTYPIFQYYMNIISFRNIEHVYKRILVDSFANSDDRIYQALLTNKNYIKLFDFTNTNTIQNILHNILCYNNINNRIKYTLRRLRYLNMIIPNLNMYFPIMFNCCSTKENIVLIPHIMKYYYTELNFTEIDLFVEILTYTNYNNTITNIKEIFTNLYDNLKTQNEKNLIIISMILRHGSAYDKKIVDGEKLFDNYKMYIETLFSYIVKEDNYMINNEFNNFIKCFGIHNISKCILLSETNVSISKIMYLLPYVVLSEGPYAKHFNILRYNISKFIKNIRNKKKMITKLKLYPILNELKNLKPSNIPVLSSNSYLLSQINQRFNTVPPYHLFPGQLQNMDNKQHFLLKEKADGILVNSMPKDIFPEPMNLLDYKLKIEYIENLDLYLVFDIDMKNSIIDRHNYIHSLHKYGQKHIPIINNLEGMIEAINNERIKLNKFLQEDYNNYRWYPKPAWYIDNIVNFIEPFTDLVNMKNSFDEWVINESKIKFNDGLILTPLDGSREIKIKPKNLYTIDLLYINNKWVDRDNIEWNVNTNCELINNTIWRCYNESFSLVAKEIRHDKTKPNTNKVATLITGLYNTEYKYVKYENIYHNIVNNNNNWDTIIKSNINIMKRMLSNIKNNSNIIDFGSGSGRTLMYLNNIIKDYTYVGLDKDINMICKAINKYSISDKIMFAYSDVARSAEEKNNWIDLNKNYYKNHYEVALMINSLMHFSTDYFWKTLDTVMKPDGLIIFNLVSMDNNYCYRFDEYFMERKNNTIYYKFPIHDNIKEEPYIDINDILKRGYTIIEEFQSKENNLTKYYKWYVLKRNKTD